MALNLGDINFGLGVDTRRLNQSVKDVVNFGQAVEAASRRSGKGAKQTAADLRKQERAAVQALRQTARLNEELRKAGAPSRFFSANTTAVQRLTQEMTRGRVSALQFQRVQARFATDMDRNKRALDRFKRGLGDTAKGTDNLTTRMRNLSGTVTLALGPLSGLGARVTALAGIANRSDLALAGLIGGIVAGTVAITKMGTAAFNTALQLDQVRARFEITSGVAGAADEFERIRELSDRTGTEFISVANAFTRVQAAARGTALEGESVNQIFEDILFGAAKFQIGADELTGSLRAVEQIMSKGSVQAEELRGQLGDRLVGAFNIAAEAMGVTTDELNKMLKAGEVASEDFLPKFAAAFRAAVGAEQAGRITTFRASLNRLTNAQTFFNDSLDQTFKISDTAERAINALADTINVLSANMDIAAGIAGAISGALLVIAGPAILRGFLALVRVIKSATTAMLGLNAAILANPAGSVATILTRLGVVALGAGAGFLTMQNAAQAATNSNRALIQSVDEFLNAQEQAGVTQRQQGQMFIKSLQEQIAAIQERNAAIVEDVRGTNIADLRRELSALESVTDLSPITTGNLRPQIEDLRRMIALVESGSSSEILAEALPPEALAELNRLESQLEALIALEENYKRQQEEREAAQKAATNAAIVNADLQISRTLQQADALMGLTGEVEALQRRFQQEDAIKKFREQLEKGEVAAEDIEDRVKRFGEALENLGDAQAAEAIRRALEPIQQIRAELEAIQAGPAVAEAFRGSRGAAAQVEEMQDALLRAGASVEDVNRNTRELITSLNELEATRAGERLVEAFGDADQQLSNLRAQVEAARESQEALNNVRGQQQIEAQVREFEKALRDAASFNELVTKDFILDKRLNDATARAGVLEGALTDVSEIRGLDQPIDPLVESINEAIARAAVLGEVLASIPKNVSPPIPPGIRRPPTLPIPSGPDSLPTIPDSGAGAGTNGDVEAGIQARVKEFRDLLTSLNTLESGFGGGSGDKAADKIAEALRNSNQELDRMRQVIDAMSQGPRALEQLFDQFEREDAVDRFRQSLESAGVAQDTINAKVAEFIGLMQRQDALQPMFDRVKEFVDVVDDQLRNALDGTARAFADVITAGEGLSSLADIGRQVASEILAAFLKLFILKPLLSDIFPGTFDAGGAANLPNAPGGSSSSGSAGGGGGFLGGIFGALTDSLAKGFGAIFSRKGNAFSNGLVQDVPMFRKGGILSGPTLFSTPTGPAIGGEAGDEGIVPLVRNSSGDLGVRTVGGNGGGNTVNFNFPPGTDVETFRKSESQLAALASRVVGRGARAS